MSKAPERIWTQLYSPAEGYGLTTIAAYDRDPREVHDNGKPVYQYALIDPAQPSVWDEAISIINLELNKWRSRSDISPRVYLQVSAFTCDVVAELERRKGGGKRGSNG
jgi:hypothetical protein